MHIGIFYSQLKQANLDYKIEYYLPRLNANNWIKERETDLNYCVYFIVDLWNKVVNTFWKYVFEYSICYIGSGAFSTNNPSRPWKLRPTTHKNDLISKMLETYPERFKIVLLHDTLGKRESQAVESYLINIALDEYGYTKTKQKCLIPEVIPKQLFNKKRELKPDTVINRNILKEEVLNGYYHRETISGKSNPN